MDVNSLVKKLLDAERNARAHREEVSSLKDQLRESELERQKLVSTVEKLKMKSQRLEAAAECSPVRARTPGGGCSKCGPSGELRKSESLRQIKPSHPAAPVVLRVDDSGGGGGGAELNQYHVLDPDIDEEYDDDVRTVPRRPPQTKKLVIQSSLSKQVKPGFTNYQPRRQLNFKVNRHLIVGASYLNQELGQKEVNYNFFGNLNFLKI